MIDPKQIPDAAVEAAVDMIDKLLAQDVSDTRILSVCAIAAALNAWPEVERIYRSEDEKLFTILLPLPHKDGDA